MAAHRSMHRLYSSWIGSSASSSSVFNIRSTRSIPLQLKAAATMSTSSSSSPPADFPVTHTIETKLSKAFSPLHHLEVRNESHMHNVPANSETHFKVIIASPVFAEHKTPLARHRAVNSVLAEEVAADGPVHALSIVAKTPEQWDKMVADGKADIGASPNCRGGDGSLPKRK
mmetsp:Transcript_22094/g.45737  ORF Transcript_22094/g.45737 Transcript_22094/m.45737 type:complete len:172 (-) Transcript_22094:265-780(-)